MECRAITEHELELILAELADTDRTKGIVETVTGQHDRYGVTALVRDGSRCMALVDHPTCLDRFLAVQAFLRNGLAGAVGGCG